MIKSYQKGDEKMQTKKTYTKVIGTQTYVNADTGEVREMQVVESTDQDKDFNFYKVFMKNLIAALGIISNKKSQVAYWCIDNLNSNNMLLYTYREIADKTGVSYQTVAVTIKALIEADFFRKLGKNLIVNPDIIFKGTYQRRVNILNMYESADAPEMSLDDRINALQQTVAKSMQQIERLKKEKEKALTTNDNDQNC